MNEHESGLIRNTAIDQGVVFPIPRDSRGRVRWQILSEDANQLKSVIEQQAGQLLQEAGNLDRSAFRRTGRAALNGAITRYYPGGIFGLKANLGIAAEKSPNGYWTAERIEKEAEDFLNEFGRINQRLLQQKEKAGLASAITRQYPGRMYGLKRKLGLPAGQKPEGYWTPERVRLEANEFYQSEGEINQRLLGSKDRQDLLAAIRKYPGRTGQLRTDINIESPRKYNWTPDEIEKAANEFLNLYGTLSDSLLKQYKSGLGRAIRKFYPGGIRSLRENLRLPSPEKPKGYWTAERTEEQALEFYEVYGKLSQKEIIKRGMSSLAWAINKYGGFRNFKKRFAISTNRQPEGQVSPDQANDQLEKLLEAGDE